jgi:hypothetical protein
MWVGSIPPYFCYVGCEAYDAPSAEKDAIIQSEKKSAKKNSNLKNT